MGIMNTNESAEWAMLRTNDEVNLWAEFEGKKLVAHEVVHLDGFNNAECRGALSKVV
jgi:hypothetical protein